MKRPNCDEMGAMRQAGDTVEMYFDRAIKIINQQFGYQMAKDHPELVVGLINAQVADFENCSRVDYMYNIADAIKKIGKTNLE